MTEGLTTLFQQSIERSLYSAEAVRELDRRLIEDCKMPGYALMQAAARACWKVLRERWPQAKSIAVVCGGGNNGGDGYEIARLARQAGFVVRVFELAPERSSGDAATARAAWLQDCGAPNPPSTSSNAITPQSFAACDVIVDAIFGTGFSRALQGPARAAIEAINLARAGGCGVLAVDLPSGLDANTGTAPSVVVGADVTVTFIGRKFGLYTAQGPECAGQVAFDSLGALNQAYENLPPLARVLDSTDLSRWLPKRPRTAHKGDHGHVLVIGGDHGMSGAVLLCARAALRAGAGLVSVATRAAHTAALTSAQPELMCHAVDSADDLRPLLQRASVVAIGPGLGTGAWGKELFEAVAEARKPQVCDADALNLLAQAPQRDPQRIITPHPGEAAHLLGRSTAGVQADRLASAAELHERYGGVAVLKGAGTLICGEQSSLCPYGNPGMGVGGMGDALTGIIAAFRAQRLGMEAAANAGVLAHALAGDRAAERGERGLLPSDLIEQLRALVNPPHLHLSETDRT